MRIFHIEMIENHFEIIDPAIKRITANPRTIRLSSSAIMPINNLELLGQNINDIIKLVMEQTKSSTENKWLSTPFHTVPKLHSIIVYVRHGAFPSFHSMTDGQRPS